MSSVDSKSTSKSNSGCIIAAIFVVLLFIVLLFCSVTGVVLLASSAGGYEDTDESVSPYVDKLAVIDISGVIVEDADSSLFSSFSGTTAYGTVEKLQKASNDDSVKAVLLRISSPGGEVVASDLIYNEVTKLAEKKPVVTYVSTMAASGGYYIAVGSDHITMHPSGMTGSIGVIMQGTNLDGLYEKLGIETVTFKSGQFKDDEELYDDNPNGEAERIYQSIIDETYEEFVAIVAEGRDMSNSEVKKLADGRIYTGKQAVANGLADDLGYYEDAVLKAESLAGVSDLTVIDYDEVSFWEALSSSKVDMQSFSILNTMPKAEYGLKMYYLVDVD